MKMHSHISSQWEDECIKTRRYLPLRKRRLQLFEIQKKDKILDLGCGEGMNMQLLTGMGIKHSTGVDISEKLLALARKKNPGHRFDLASADALPYNNESFDIVLIDSVFHHIINSDNTMKEIQRVLKKGGYLCFSEPHRSLARTFFDFVTLSPLAPLLPFFNNRRPAYLAEKDLVNNWLDHEKEFLDTLPDKGFKKIFRRYDLLSVVGKYQKV